MSAPVTNPGDAVHPGDLLANLAGDEGLEQVSQLLQRARVTPSQLLARQAQQPGRQARVDDVQLRLRARPRSQRPAPCRQPVDEEEGFEELRVVVGGAGLEARRALGGVGETGTSWLKLEGLLGL
jgi:hypothetical protein